MATPNNNGWATMTTRADLQRLLVSPRIRAFLHAIRLGEGTSDPNGYKRLVGGGEFEDYAAHPNRLIQVRAGLYSTAAGAYQFLYRTWAALQKQYGFPAFDPACQDEAAVALLVEKGAHRFIEGGQIQRAVAAVARVWASLPGSPYGQPTVTMDRFMREYYKWLPEDKPMTETQPNTTADTVQTVATVVGAATGQMWVGPALTALRGLWPELGKLFKPGTSEVAQRNVKAAEAVVNAVIEATGAKNAQEAVESVHSDASAAATARTAAIGTLDQFGLIDATGVADARKFSSEIGPPIWHTGAFWLTGAMIPLIYYVTHVVVDNDSKFGSDTRAFVVGAVLGTLLGSMLAYWLGTSASSQKKTDLMAQK